MNQPQPPIIEKLLSASTTLDGLCKRITGEQSQEIAAAKNQLKEAILTLVVAGEIKKGKSSFINALLQQPGLVAIADKVATSIACKIHYADVVSHRVQFFPDPDDQTREPLAIDGGQVAEYTTEEGNPGNNKNVAFVAIGCPSPLLENGIVLVDTPGIGGLVKSHRGITERFVPNADAVLYVTDSGNPLDAADLDFLKLLLKRTEFIYFLQTKSDTAASIEAKDEIRRANLKRLDEIGIRQPVNYFICSSRLKAIADESGDVEDLEDSGFLPVQDFILDTLKSEKDRIVCASVLLSIESISARLGTEIGVRLKAYRDESEAERQRLQKEIGAARKKLEQWQREELPLLQNDVTKQMQQLRTQVQREVEGVLDLQTGKAFEELKSEIDAFSDIETLKQNYTTLLDRAASFATDCLYKQKSAIERTASHILEQTCERLAQEMPEVGERELTVSAQLSIPSAASPKDSSSSFSAKSLVLGRGGQYASYAAIAGGLVLGPVGALVGMCVGAWFGGSQQLKELREQKVNAAKTKAKEDIARCFSRYSKDILSRLSDLFIEVESGLTKLFREIVRQHQDSLERLYLEFQERGKISQEQSAARQRELESDRQSLKQLHCDLKEIQSLIVRK